MSSERERECERERAGGGAEVEGQTNSTVSSEADLRAGSQDH